MMSVYRLPLTVLAILGVFLQGCAIFLDERARNCSPSGAYERGLNDALSGKLLHTAPLQKICSNSPNLNEILDSYSVGFKEGSKQSSSEKFVGAVISHYRCALKGEKQVYEAQDKTLADAQSRVRSLCLKDGAPQKVCGGSQVQCTGF